jgi:hypothetical protein
VRRAGAALVAQRRQRRMEQLGGVAIEGLADLGTVRCVQPRQPGVTVGGAGRGQIVGPPRAGNRPSLKSHRDFSDGNLTPPLPP